MAVLPTCRLVKIITEAAASSAWRTHSRKTPSNNSQHFVFLRNGQRCDAIIYVGSIISNCEGASQGECSLRFEDTTIIRQIPGIKTLIIGYWDANDVFAGWDASKHSGPVANSPSLQIREDYLLKANTDGLAVYPKANDEVAVAFSPSLFITYLQNLQELHSAISAQEQAVLTRVAEDAGQVDDVDLQPLPPERQRIIRTIAQNQRASDFRKRVLTAYGNTCAICGLQLDLVDAAHIVPVKHPESTDNTDNGICLCALHHRAFDNGLLAVLPDYRIVINSQKVAILQAANRASGLGSFLDNLRTQIRLPAEQRLRPTARTINTAIEVRELNQADLRAPNALVI